ncbi:hypothetical protein EDC01DRAFT_759796 [Geopyxis carbonaria]|nr:hypothetical protein EDC01DRAFT_759796 [Geopyxis carbonaria]
MQFSTLITALFFGTAAVALSLPAANAGFTVLNNETYKHTLTPEQAAIFQLTPSELTALNSTSNLLDCSTNPSACATEARRIATPPSDDAAARVYYVVCETTSGSPPVSGALRNAVYLGVMPADRMCCQTGSRCTNMVSLAGTGSDICGPRGTCTFCNIAAEFLHRILADCQRNGRVGGYVRQDAYTVNVYVR